MQRRLGLTGVMWSVIGLDWKLPAKSADKLMLDVGGTAVEVRLDKPGAWQRTVVAIESKASGSGITFKPTAGLEVMNVFVTESKEK